MRIAQINMLPYGSTGKIMLQIGRTVTDHGHQSKLFVPVMFSRTKKGKTVVGKEFTEFGSFWENCLHYYFGTIFGMNGCFSQIGTRQMIRELKEFNPDIIHLHNLHGFCINLPMLFRYIKKNHIRVVWTLHDCWSFTGHCPYFTMVKCDRWKNGCFNCPQPRIYPKMYLDTSKIMYKMKKKWFSGIADMTVVTPSQWLADLAKQSFMKSYPVKVINNGIDLNTFKPTPSDFREHYGIKKNQYIILGVAFGWGERKGLDVFVELAERLDDRYQIVLVGTDERVDAGLPRNVIAIHTTQNQQELAQIYSAANLLVNPTREENYPTVNMESIACGTPVLTFRTGGSPEILDVTCGSVVDYDDIDALEREIKRICVEQPYREQACLTKSRKFDKNEKFEEYVRLYEKY